MKPILTLLFLSSLLHAQPAAVAENSAVVPVGKLEKDFYDWDKRHAEILSIKDRINPEVVLIGDSITHFWGGEPTEPKGNRGAESWENLLGKRKVLNLGFGWDRTQNVLYRIQNGELDGLSPKLAVIHIGTNNLSTSKNAPTNTPAEVAEGIDAIVTTVKKKCPQTKIVLMAVFPRGEKGDNPFRGKISEINQILAKTYGSQQSVTYLDITQKFLNSDGSIPKEVMGDFLHPSAKGYSIWAEALKPYLP